MKYKIGDRVYLRRRKFTVIASYMQGGWQLLTLSGLRGLIDASQVKPIVRCANEQ